MPPKAGDHAVGRALVFDLDHGALAGAIRLIETLGHDAVEAGALETPEPVLRERAVARGRGEVHGRRPAGKQLLEPFSPRLERRLAQVLVA